MICPILFAPQPCARCGMPVTQDEAVPVLEIEQGSGREYPRWAHPREVCRENLA